MPSNETDEAWKAVSSQSERHLGIYIDAHLLLTKRAPKMLKGSEVQFRNEVIHKGKVPSKGAAAKYGDAAQVLIEEGLAELRSLCSEARITQTRGLLAQPVEAVPQYVIA